MAMQMHPSLAVHPGDWLKTEVVEVVGVEINDIAENFGVSRQTISGILNSRTSLTASMAIRFEKAFGIKADTLMRMQSRYDLARAHDVVDEEPIRKYAFG